MIMKVEMRGIKGVLTAIEIRNSAMLKGAEINIKMDLMS